MRDIETDPFERQLLRQQALAARGGSGLDVNGTMPVGGPVAGPTGPPSPLDAARASGGNVGPWKDAYGAQPAGVPALPDRTPGPTSPGTSPLSWGDVGRASGFNTNEWANPTQGYDINSTKNNFGKIATRYDPADPQAAQKLYADPDFKQRFPNAKLVPGGKGDMIDFGDGRPVDVIQNAGAPNAKWAWQTQDAMGAPGAPTGAPGGAGLMAQTGGVDPAAIMAGNPLDQIQSELGRIVQGGGGDTQALLQRLLQGGGGI